MRLKKVYCLLLAIPFLAIACGGEEEIAYRRHISSEIRPDSFRMFAFNADKDSLEINQLDTLLRKRPMNTFFPDTLFENYSSTTISFLGDNEIIIDPQQRGSLPEISRYEYVDGSFYIFNGETPVYLGDGDHKQIDARRHFVGYKRLGDTRFHYIRVAPRKDIDENIASGQTPIQSIDRLVEGDTVFWGTRYSLFM